MPVILSDIVAQKIADALGVKLDDNYAIIIRLVAGDVARVEIINYGTYDLDKFDWSILKDAEIKLKDVGVTAPAGG